MASDEWAADGLVSIPEARGRASMVDFGGFSFTTGGIAHDISDDEIEELLIPTYGPVNQERG